MPFFIETWDKPDHQHLRASTRARHLEFLAQNADKLLACGAKLHDDGTDIGGGIYIVDVQTPDEAKAFIAADPFSAVDLFERVNITRWRKAYVDGRCFLN